VFAHQVQLLQSLVVHNCKNYKNNKIIFIKITIYLKIFNFKIKDGQVLVYPVLLLVLLLKEIPYIHQQMNLIL